jgi:hypothetical protein
MSEKGLKALVGIVAVLCAVWATVTFLPRGGGAPGASHEALSGFFLGVTPETASTLRFQGPGEEAPVVLTRQAGTWSANRFQADSSTVAAFWSAVGQVEVGDLVGSNPSNHARLGVSPDSAWRLEVEMPEGARTLLLGKSGPRYGTAYVRLPDQDEVYLLDGGLRPTVTRTLADWRNKRVARVDTSRVQRIRLEQADAQVTLARADTIWALEDGTEANGATVRNLLAEMARLDATGFYAPGDSLADLAGTLRAMDGSGGTLLFLEMGSGEGDRWVRVEGDSIVYKVASWRAGRILPEAGALRGGG